MDGIERAGLTLPWCRDLLAAAVMETEPKRCQLCPLRVRDSVMCSLRPFSPCSWDSMEGTVLCCRPFLPAPGAGSSSAQPHLEESQRRAMLQQHGCARPACTHQQHLSLG